MWNMELAFIIAMEKGQCEVSCLPRAKISRLRPKDSIFHPAVSLSVVLQAIIHLYVLNKGVHGASMWQSERDSHRGGLSIRLMNSALAGVMPVTSSAGSKEGNLLGRSPFRPNCVTNVVFLLSIFQNVMITLINHSGLPFHGSLLESRSFCIWATVSVLMCIAMVLEVEPGLNKILQLAPMTAKSFRTFVLSLFLFDGLASFAADRLCLYFLDRDLWRERRNPIEFAGTSELASDMEEKLLADERKKNAKVIGILIAGCLLSVSYRFITNQIES